jgi:hypothetical protein
MSYYLILVRFRGLLCYLTQYHIFRVLFIGFSQGRKRSCLVLIITPLLSATPKWRWPESNESGVATTP